MQKKGENQHVFSGSHIWKHADWSWTKVSFLIFEENKPLYVVFIFLILLKTAKNILISYLNIIREKAFNMHSMYKQDK